MQHSDKTIVFIHGPTAVGKTRLAIELAQKLNTEIISTDSRQFYRELEIGTAKPSEKELDLVPHHFINHLSIYDKPYSAGAFSHDAQKFLDDFWKTNHIIIATGGSGLYSLALSKGLDDFPPISSAVKEDVQSFFELEGLEAIQKLLLQKDPDYYHRVDLSNHRRILRALEVCQESGKPYSSFLSNPDERKFSVIEIVLQRNRDILYQRINRRVDEMIELGLQDEVSGLQDDLHLPALQTVGYKEWKHYFNGEWDQQEVIEKIKQHTRNYAKRQITWFKKYVDGPWFDAEDFNGVLKHVETVLSS